MLNTIKEFFYPTYYLIQKKQGKRFLYFSGSYQGREIWTTQKAGSHVFSKRELKKVKDQLKGAYPDRFRFVKIKKK